VGRRDDEVGTSVPGRSRWGCWSGVWWWSSSWQCRRVELHKRQSSRRCFMLERDSLGQPLRWILYNVVTLLNSDQFSKLFHCQNQKKIPITPSLKIPPHLKCVATLPCEMSLSEANCHSVSLITPLDSGVTGLNASSSSKVDTYNIWCKNCRMWQLL